MATIRLGIIGMGGMGNTHYNNAQKIEGLVVTAVCDLDASRMEKFTKEKRFTDSAALIGSGLVDAIVVCTPHYFHPDIAIAGLKAGLHVLTEKPVAVHVNDAKRMIAAHTDKSRVFAVMFQQRANPAFRKLKSMITSGETGALRRVNWIVTDWFRTEAYYASGGWRATWKGEGGGVLLNQCPHNLDLLQWLVGLPERVTATIALGRYHDIEVEDDVTAILEYPDGVTGIFSTTTGVAPGTNRLELSFENGRIVLENNKIVYTKNEIPMTEYRKTANDMWGVPKTSVVEYDFTGDYGGQHHALLENFRDAIRDGKPLIAGAEEGIRALSLGNAMLLSGLLKRPVGLPLDGDLFQSELETLIKTSRFVKAPVRTDVEGDINKSFGIKR
jgi:predicted dehydrogenase